MSENWIRASDISEYLYCRRAWWLHRVQGAPTRHRRLQQAGRRHHQEHAADVARAERSRRLAYGVLAVAALLLVVLLVRGV
jgi:CRISPR/Cas system-associated exonuclease Cas4 (RecB family)